MRISDWSSDVCSSDLSLVRYEAAWERRIGDGSLVVAARHESISNLVDRVVVVSDDGTFDSAGNIGHATRDEVEANLNLPLDPLGLRGLRSEEHTSELQSLMRISYAVFCLKKKQQTSITH